MSQTVEQAIARLPNKIDETLTVSTAAVGLDSSIYNPSGDAMPNNRTKNKAFLLNRGDDIRITKTGTDPTATVGTFLAAGENYTLNNLHEIINFRSIRDTGASGNATLTINYLG